MILLKENMIEKDIQDHKDTYIELAEKRAVEKLGLDEEKVAYCKAYENAKAEELEVLKERYRETIRKNIFLSKYERKKPKWYHKLFFLPY